MSRRPRRSSRPNGIQRSLRWRSALRFPLPGASPLLRSDSPAREFAADASAVIAAPSMAKALATNLLRDGELIVLILRPSLWYILLSSLRWIISAVVLTIFTHRLTLQRDIPTHAWVEFCSTAVAARLMWAGMLWSGKLYILTNLRLLALNGVLKVEVFDCPLRKVARTRLILQSPDRYLNVGSIEMVPQDDSAPFGLWQSIARPVAVHEQITAAINRAKQCGGLSGHA